MIVLDENIFGRIVVAGFKTRVARMGKILRVRHHHIDYYEIGSNQIVTLNWPAF